jgi:hypothetical protein
MKVWAVIQGFPYEGENFCEDFSSLRLFHDTVRGKAAAEKLCAYYDSDAYAYGTMVLIEVNE